MKQLENISGIRIENNEVVIKVLSNGCTDKNSFAFEIDNNLKTPVLSIFRVVQDECKEFEKIIELKFSKKEIGYNGNYGFKLENIIKFY